MNNTNPIAGRLRALFLTASAVLMALLLGAASARAQTDTIWTRGAGTTNWTDAANWSAGVPVAGYNAIFSTNAGGDPSQTGTLTMGKITFSNTAAHTLGIQTWQ